MWFEAVYEKRKLADISDQTVQKINKSWPKKIPYNLQFTVDKIDRELWLPSIARYVVVINISLTTKK